jgi:hypothetical protein
VAEHPNVFTDTFTVERGSLRGEPVARKAGAELLGGMVYELAPGADGAPLHIHHAMEELLVVLEGTPSLRVSTKTAPEIVEYPELGTIRVTTFSPFDPPGPDEDPADRLRLLFERSAATDETLPG